MYALWSLEKYETIKDVCESIQINYDTVEAHWLPMSRRLSDKVKELVVNPGVNSFSDRHARMVMKYPHSTQDRLAEASVKRGLTSRQLQDLRGDRRGRSLPLGAKAENARAS